MDIFLSKGQNGYLQYQDTSTGKSVSRLRIPHGRCDCLTSNPYNAVVQLGHANGLSYNIYNLSERRSVGLGLKP